ncbi:MarR family transcriptional regulator (plasmid) [Gordonia polyisoprenivorans VH2]|uniref:MarR family transcriptional regulator n=1 Tax=Gordonia polyisoprenivorans (strain DSM 44266 / VH2) TaxID=1112204 RepID=H6N4Y9_GORPV|nr:MarR family winged helix-turn-helix transcriptional regulator [Gordonia polyisoprenivorans]AFA76034.1 MarR family transcriptional regulator [Gordonia polyisoprenivorans VH2]
MVSFLPGLKSDESDLWVALTVFSQLLTPAMDQRLRSVDLTLFEFGALMSLMDSPTLSLRIGEMAERTYAPLPRMSKVVRRLEQRGLIDRVRSADDARAFSIEITHEGRSVVLRAARIQSDAAKELVLTWLSAEEVTTLAPVLTRLVQHLDPDGPLGPA